MATAKMRRDVSNVEAVEKPPMSIFLQKTDSHSCIKYLLQYKVDTELQKRPVS